MVHVMDPKNKSRNIAGIENTGKEHQQSFFAVLSRQGC